MFKELMKEMLKEELGIKSAAKTDSTTKTDLMLHQYLQVGKSYHIRTVTMDYAGTVKAFDDEWVLLENASWVPDSGRFSEYLKDTSKVSENEPFIKDVLVHLGPASDITEIDHPFTKVK